MRDTGLYQQILGLSEPWKVTAVTMDETEQVITVEVEPAPGVRLACPACGRADCSIKDRRGRN